MIPEGRRGSQRDGRPAREGQCTRWKKCSSAGGSAAIAGASSQIRAPLPTSSAQAARQDGDSISSSSGEHHVCDKPNGRSDAGAGDRDPRRRRQADAGRCGRMSLLGRTGLRLRSLDSASAALRDLPRSGRRTHADALRHGLSEMPSDAPAAIARDACSRLRAASPASAGRQANRRQPNERNDQLACDRYPFASDSMQRDASSDDE
jgi:hypothetical protein